MAHYFSENRPDFFIPARSPPMRGHDVAHYVHRVTDNRVCTDPYSVGRLWQYFEPLKRAPADCHLLVYEDNLFCIGGVVGGKLSRIIMRSEDMGDIWKFHSETPFSARWGMSSIISEKGYVFLLCGAEDETEQASPSEDILLGSPDSSMPGSNVQRFEKPENLRYSPENFYPYLSEVWVSFDGLKTWQIRCAYAPFPPRVSATCFAVGNFLFMSGGTAEYLLDDNLESIQYLGRWVSEDDGLSWRSHGESANEALKFPELQNLVKSRPVSYQNSLIVTQILNSDSDFDKFHSLTEQSVLQPVPSGERFQFHAMSNGSIIATPRYDSTPFWFSRAETFRYRKDESFVGWLRKEWMSRGGSFAKIAQSDIWRIIKSFLDLYH